MGQNNPGDKPSKSAKGESKPAKKDKQSIDPAQRGPGGFNRSQLRGKAPIFRTLKKSGR
ncbi:MAG: hypothetical protein JWO30_3434 [Fibrobacteres bacterium]|nr:hypothetical protein [Fibrobacterota bacterium]